MSPDLLRCTSSLCLRVWRRRDQRVVVSGAGTHRRLSNRRRRLTPRPCQSQLTGLPLCKNGVIFVPAATAPVQQEELGSACMQRCTSPAPCCKAPPGCSRADSSCGHGRGTIGRLAASRTATLFASAQSSSAASSTSRRKHRRSCGLQLPSHPLDVSVSVQS